MLKRLYDWVMGWADSPYGTPALFLLALGESSFFPIPPDVLLMALAISIPRRALFYAGVCTGGSVLGGMLGYVIGLEFYELMGKHIIEFYGVSEQFDTVGRQYQANAFAAVAIAGRQPDDLHRRLDDRSLAGGHLPDPGNPAAPVPFERGQHVLDADVVLGLQQAPHLQRVLGPARAQVPDETACTQSVAPGQPVGVV